MAVAIGSAVTVSQKWGRHAGVDEKITEDALLYVVIGGIMGARLYHVIDYWEFYSTHLTKILALWEGGLGIIGAIGGGLAGLYIYHRLHSSSSWWQLVDTATLGLPLGQAIGRIGNFLNQELYGPPTSLSWGIYIDPANRLPGYESFETFHPLFLYESMTSLLLFGVIYLLWKKNLIKVGNGTIFAVYLVGYGLIRFVLEYLRIDPWRLAFLTTAQWLGLVMILTGITWLYKMRRI